MSESLLSLFDEGELDTLAWEERDDGLLAFSNNEDVGNSGSEGVTCSILNVSDVERARVLLNVLEDTNSTDVVTTDDQDLSSVFVLDQAFDLSSLEIQL